jgi:predicted phosphodiesterase
MSIMKRTNWTEIEREESTKMHRREIAYLLLELEQTKSTLRRTLEARKVKLPAAKVADGRQEGDIIRVIIPDTHGAKADRAAIAVLLADIKTIDPQEIILLGDHVDCGGFLAQHLIMGYVAETAYSYEEDLEHGNAFLDSLRFAAPHAKIEYLEGNHERRVETWCVTQTLRHSKDAERLRQLYAPEFRLNLAERGIPYYRQAVFYDGLSSPGMIQRGKCFFFHGISTAKNAVMETLVKIGGNCVFGHTHRQQSEVVRRLGIGVIGGWNPGCLCELQPLWQHTKPTEWTHGYAVQLVSADGGFLHLNIPILEGASHFTSLFKI